MQGASAVSVSPSLNSYSSGKLAEIAARVVHVVCREPEYSSPISADEIFYNGQIKPFYPIFDQTLLRPNPSRDKDGRRINTQQQQSDKLEASCRQQLQEGAIRKAGKEFVDFLFGLIHIPTGSIMGLLWNHGMAGPGSLSRVYESIQILDPTCLHQTKEELLMPEPAFPSGFRFRFSF